ncbi:MAG: hypothetical protein D6816_10265, partial [Bacteroidetes bacterium]
ICDLGRGALHHKSEDIRCKISDVRFMIGEVPNQKSDDIRYLISDVRFEIGEVPNLKSKIIHHKS